MWEIIDYHQEHFHEMLEMTIENYGVSNHISDKDFIEYEYFSNPEGNAFIKLAYDREQQRLAGQYIVIPRRFFVDGRLMASVLSLNTLTRAEYRGQQVFTRLAEAVYEECRKQNKYFCYGAPNQNSFHGFIKKLAFDNIGKVPLYLKILNPYRLICDKIHIPYKHTSSEIKYSDRKAEHNQKEDLQIVEVTDKNIYLFDLFWERIRYKYSVIGVRDAEYIKWRYLHMPLREYTLYMAVQNQKPLGYIIGRISEVAGMRCGMLVDFLVVKGKHTAANMLLDKIISDFKKHRIGLLGCLMKEESEEAGYLNKKGFFVCPQKLLPQPFPIILRQFGHLNENSNKALNNFSHWFFTMGDYDVI